MRELSRVLEMFAIFIWGVVTQVRFEHVVTYKFMLIEK